MKTNTTKRLQDTSRTTLKQIQQSNPTTHQTLKDQFLRLELQNQTTLTKTDSTQYLLQRDLVRTIQIITPNPVHKLEGQIKDTQIEVTFETRKKIMSGVKWLYSFVALLLIYLKQSNQNVQIETSKV